METLFTQALGLVPPWAVSSYEFSQEAGRIDFHVRCDAPRLACPACGAGDQPIHDVKARSWRHLNFFQYQAWIHAEVPRVACGKCGKTTQAAVPWARKGSGFSELMEAFIVALCREMPMAAVARLLGVSDNRVGRVLDFHVAAARVREQYANVRAVAVDERSARRGQRYVTVFHDAQARRVLFAVPGRKADTFAAFVEDLAAHAGDAAAIETVSMDMSKAYQAGAREHCPSAKLCFDPFHVVGLAHQALEQVRRQEVKEEDGLKGIRWATLKDAANWTRNQVYAMHFLQHSNLKTARAWRIKEAVRAVFRDCKDAATARKAMVAVISWARRSRLAPFKRLGATLREHLEGIVEHFRCGLSNGYAEAMNGLIDAAKRRARGYATDQRLITIIYLLGGKLKHLPVNPWLRYATPAT